MGDGVGGMVFEYSAGGDCVRLCVCKGDGVGAMPRGMMMLGDGVGLGNGMGWGGGRHTANPLSKIHRGNLQKKVTPVWGLL